MRIALGLALVGFALGAVAVTGWLSAPRDVGDARSVEEALATTTSTNPATAATLVATTPSSLPPETTTSSTPSDVEPQWHANGQSLLSDLVGVQALRPERLLIPVLGVDAPVGAYGVDGNGRMDVADNVTEVAWYKHGPSPGQPGSAVLAAHVDMRGPGPGLFFDLDTLDVGEAVEVGYSDGSTKAFRVTARSTYLKTELPLDVIFSRTGDPVLTLITCGGGFSDSSLSYDSNVVVYAVPA